MPDTELLPYVPSRCCLGCPHRGTCHPARQRVQDPQLEAGRHYACPFYRSISGTLREKRFGWFWWFAAMGRRP